MKYLRVLLIGLFLPSCASIFSEIPPRPRTTLDITWHGTTYTPEGVYVCSAIGDRFVCGDLNKFLREMQTNAYTL